MEYPQEREGKSMSTLGEAFSTIYKETGISKKDLEARLNTDRSTRYRWEQGKSWPDSYSLEEIKRVTKELNPKYYELVLGAIEEHESEESSPKKEVSHTSIKDEWKEGFACSLDECFFETPLSVGEKDLVFSKIESLADVLKEKYIITGLFRDIYLPRLIWEETHSLKAVIFDRLQDVELKEFCILSRINTYLRSDRRSALYDLTVRCIPDTAYEIFDIKVVRRGLFSWAISISLTEKGKQIFTEE